MTYNVLMETLNHTHSLTRLLFDCNLYDHSTTFVTAKINIYMSAWLRLACQRTLMCNVTVTLVTLAVERPSNPSRIIVVTVALLIRKVRVVERGRTVVSQQDMVIIDRTMTGDIDHHYVYVQLVRAGHGHYRQDDDR